MNYYCAPMEGITSSHFRKAHHRHFPGVTKYFTPFFYPSQHHVMGKRDYFELSHQQNHGIPTVPQVLTKVADDFIWASTILADMGYSEVNLNLGCPSGTVFSKGKGSGFLAKPNELDTFLGKIFSNSVLPISIKTRIGVESPDEFHRLLEIYNKYPMSELIIHPRVRTDYYKKTVTRSAFDEAFTTSPLPLCYNGDLFSLKDCTNLADHYPTLSSVMIGRGLISNPALITRLQSNIPTQKSTLRSFHDELFEGYTIAFESKQNAMLRMKEYWSYLSRLFTSPEKHLKALRKAQNPTTFTSCVDAFFDDLDLLDEATPWN